MTNLTAVADAYAAAATAFRSLRGAATAAADGRRRRDRNTPDASCYWYLEDAMPKLHHAIRLADSCKLDAAVAIVPMSAYAASAAAAAVHDAKYLLNETAYLDVVQAAIEARDVCDQAETIFREQYENDA